MAGGIKPRISVEGGRELRRALDGLEGGLEDLRDLHERISADVVSESRSLAPELSGRLARSIRGKGGKARATVRAGGRRIPYAGVIHFGWPGHNIEPSPYLYEAIDNQRQSIVGKYEGEVDRLLREADARMPHKR